MHAWAAWLLDAAVKGTAVLAIAAVAQLVWRRASAAERHAVWLLALLLALLWPAGSALLPPRPAPESDAIIVQAGSSVGSVGSGSEPEQETAGVLERIADLKASNRGMSHLPQGSNATGIISWPIPDWTPSIIWVWLTGLTFVLARKAAVYLRLMRLRRRATKFQDGNWTRELHEIAESLGITRPVQLLESADITIPATCGNWHPIILLPETARHWSATRRHLVLLHELSHVLRRDCLTQSISDWICAIYWFNPLAWLAARRMRFERECACDDLVLRSGQRASEYASHLVDLADGMRRGPGLATGAIGMASPSRLQARVVAIVNPSAVRRCPRRWVIGCFIGAGLLVTSTAPRPIATGMLFAQDATSPAAALEAGPHSEPGSSSQSPYLQQLRVALETQRKDVAHLEKKLGDLKKRHQLADSDDGSDSEPNPPSSQARGIEAVMLDLRMQIIRLDALASVLEKLESNSSTGMLMTLLPNDPLLQHLLVRKLDAELDLETMGASKSKAHPDMVSAASAVKLLNEKIERHLEGITQGMRTKQRNLEAELSQAQKDGSMIEVGERRDFQAIRDYIELKRGLENAKLKADVLTRKLAQETYKASRKRE